MPNCMHFIEIKIGNTRAVGYSCVVLLDVLTESALLGLTSPVEGKQALPDLIACSIEALLQDELVANVQIVALLKAEGAPANVAQLLVAGLIGIPVKVCPFQ